MDERERPRRRARKRRAAEMSQGNAGGQPSSDVPRFARRPYRIARVRIKAISHRCSANKTCPDVRVAGVPHRGRSTLGADRGNLILLGP